MSPPSPVAAPAASTRWAPLPGGTAVWVFMTVELATFGMFLVGHAWGWRQDAAGYADAQALLHVDSAVRGTALLLVGSWTAYRGLLAHEAERRPAAAGWLAAAAGLGLLFTANKLVEYASPELADITLSTHRFWFGYLFLTGLHLLHVVGGVGLFAWLALKLRAGPLGTDPPISVAAAATYWHLVDLIWVLLFPILYLVHP